MWKYEYIEGWIRATCQNCGNEVEFPSKKRKPIEDRDRDIERNFAEYENRNGHLFLRTNNWPKFIEVGLRVGRKKRKKYLRVVPIHEANFVPNGDFNPLKDSNKKLLDY